MNKINDVEFIVTFLLEELQNDDPEITNAVVLVALASIQGKIISYFIPNERANTVNYLSEIIRSNSELTVQ